jgi:hypothetical protein
MRDRDPVPFKVPTPEERARGERLARWELGASVLLAALAIGGSWCAYFLWN